MQYILTKNSDPKYIKNADKSITKRRPIFLNGKKYVNKHFTREGSQTINK